MTRVMSFTVSRKYGSVSIETAISMSVVLVFMTAIISVAVFLKTDILMQRAVNQTCEDFAHFTPLSVAGSDMISTLVNAVPGDLEVPDIVTDLSSFAVSGMNLGGDNITALILDSTLQQCFADDIASGYSGYNGGYFFGPDEISVDFEIYDNYIDVCVVYEVDTIIGPISRQVVSGIPFYGDFELFLSGNEGNGEDDDIWHQNNFTRGHYFQNKYGANLPSTFPVIDYYEDGRCASIVSLDLNKSTYFTPAAAALRVTSEIDSLAGFDGAQANISGKIYSVDGSSINSRQLIVVIPEDSPESNSAAIRALSSYALGRGVELTVIEDGCSL